MKKRFNRATLIQDLLDRADDIKRQHNFTDLNGTNQLKVRNLNRGDLIVQAVAYGRMRALQHMAVTLHDGQIGVPKEDEQ